MRWNYQWEYYRTGSSLCFIDRESMQPTLEFFECLVLKAAKLLLEYLMQ